MRNCSDYEMILKKSKAVEGLKDPKYGLSASPSSSFSPLFKGAGGVHAHSAGKRSQQMLSR